MLDPFAAAEQIGPSLSRLVRRLASPLRLVVHVGTFRTERRATFRLEFEDGTVLKGRRLESAEDAARNEWIRREVGGPGMARLIARVQDALLEEWVEGVSLASKQELSRSLASCGAFLGRLHAHRFEESRWGRAAVDSGSLWLKLRTQIETLRSSGLLPEDLAKETLSRAEAVRPQRFSRGFIHRDLCPENLVVRASGEIVCIDNVSMRFDAHDLDLARTWYRWPLDHEHASPFLTEYARFRDPKAFLDHWVFWMSCVLVSSACFRQRIGVPAPAILEPIERLRGILES